MVYFRVFLGGLVFFVITLGNNFFVFRHFAFALLSAGVAMIYLWIWVAILCFGIRLMGSGTILF